MTVAGIKTEVNLNTVIAVVGFLITIGSLIGVWNRVQYKQEDFDKWIAAHDKVHDAISVRIGNLEQNDTKMIDFAFRLGQLEKQETSLDDRIGRITESYGNQFSDIRSQLGAIATQLALTNQTLQAIAGNRVGAPKELR